MKKLKERKNYVRIIIGNVNPGEKNMSKPIKSVSVTDTSVDEVYKEIDNMLEQKSKDK
jgi:hypothetical protein